MISLKLSLKVGEILRLQNKAIIEQSLWHSSDLHRWHSSDTLHFSEMCTNFIFSMQCALCRSFKIAETSNVKILNISENSDLEKEIKKKKKKKVLQMFHTSNYVFDRVFFLVLDLEVWKFRQ